MSVSTFIHGTSLVGRYTYLRIQGEIDIYTSPEFEDALRIGRAARRTWTYR